MAINNFNDLNGYVEQLSSLASNFYDDKVNVNEIDSNLLSTHVTAEDLNHIKTSLSAVIENVNAINNHLINYQSSIDGNERQTTSDTISNSLNNYLANDYVRKDQLIVDEKYVNDSVAHLDDVYLRSKNIFIDGYKISTTSQYNLVSFNQLTLTINGLTGSFNAYFQNLLNEIRTHNNTDIFIDTLTTWNSNEPTIPSSIYTKTPGTNYINLTVPIQKILDVASSHTFSLSTYVIQTNLQYDNWISHVQSEGAKNYLHFKTIQNNEYGYGMRLIGNGYKFYNKNDILDPSYREYKWFRIYSANYSGSLSQVTKFFDPTFESVFIGNNYPISSTVTVSNKALFKPTNNQFKVKQYIDGGYNWATDSQGPSNGANIPYQGKNEPVKFGWARGWMECGGQQRVYMELKEDGFIYCQPSTIIFPIPFENQQGLDIQITAKRDMVEPFPYIVPFAVINEDCYYFDIGAGGQGIPTNGTNTISGFMYIKWEAKGLYLENGLRQFWFNQKGYDKLHDLYWINESVTNTHYQLQPTSTPFSRVIDSEEDFQNITCQTLARWLYIDQITSTLATAIANYVNTSPEPDVTQPLSYHLTVGNLSSALTNLSFRDHLLIMSSAVDFINPTYISKLTDNLGYFYPEHGADVPPGMLDYLSTLIGTVWDKTKIREYKNTNFSITNSSYKEATNKLPLSVGSIWTHQDPNFYGSLAYYQATVPTEQNSWDDDRYRLRSTITGQITEWTQYE